jgi:hypothetical protein
MAYKETLEENMPDLTEEEYDKMCLVRKPETAYEEKRENSAVMEHITA